MEGGGGRDCGTVNEIFWASTKEEKKASSCPASPHACPKPAATGAGAQAVVTPIPTWGAVLVNSGGKWRILPWLSSGEIWSPDGARVCMYFQKRDTAARAGPGMHRCGTWAGPAGGLASSRLGPPARRRDTVMSVTRTDIVNLLCLLFYQAGLRGRVARGDGCSTVHRSGGSRGGGWRGSLQYPQPTYGMDFLRLFLPWGCFRTKTSVIGI